MQQDLQVYNQHFERITFAKRYDYNKYKYKKYKKFVIVTKQFYNSWQYEIVKCLFEEICLKFISGDLIVDSLNETETRSVCCIWTKNEINISSLKDLLIKNKFENIELCQVCENWDQAMGFMKEAVNIVLKNVYLDRNALLMNKTFLNNTCNINESMQSQSGLLPMNITISNDFLENQRVKPCTSNTIKNTAFLAKSKQTKNAFTAIRQPNKPQTTFIALVENEHKTLEDKPGTSAERMKDDIRIPSPTHHTLNTSLNATTDDYITLEDERDTGAEHIKDNFRMQAIRKSAQFSTTNNLAIIPSPTDHTLNLSLNASTDEIKAAAGTPLKNNTINNSRNTNTTSSNRSSINLNQTDEQILTQLKSTIHDAREEDDIEETIKDIVIIIRESNMKKKQFIVELLMWVLEDRPFQLFDPFVMSNILMRSMLRELKDEFVLKKGVKLVREMQRTSYEEDGVLNTFANELDDQSNWVKDVILWYNEAVRNYKNVITKALYLHGASGVGKTTVIELLLANKKEHIFIPCMTSDYPLSGLDPDQHAVIVFEEFKPESPRLDDSQWRPLVEGKKVKIRTKHKNDKEICFPFPVIHITNVEPPRHNVPFMKRVLVVEANASCAHLIAEYLAD